MKKILYFTGMLVVLVTAACGNRNNRDGATTRDSVPMTPYDTPIDTMGRDSTDSIISPTPVPVTPPME